MKSFKSYLTEALTTTGTPTSNAMKGMGADGAGDFATRTGAKVSRTSKNKNGPMGFELPTNLNVSQDELDKYSGNVYTALSARGAEVRDKKTRQIAVDLKSPIKYDKVPSPHEWNIKANATLNQTLDDIAQQNQTVNNEKMISHWIDGKGGVSSVVKNAVSYKSMIRQLKTAVREIGPPRGSQAPHDIPGVEERPGELPIPLEPTGVPDMENPYPWDVPWGRQPTPVKPKPPQIDPNFLNPPENRPWPPMVKPTPKPTPPPDTAPPLLRPFAPDLSPWKFPWWAPLAPFFLIPFPGNPALAQKEDVDHSQNPRKRLLTFGEFN
jgi:hypothetical protein